MLVRATRNPLLDVAVCALQGFGGAKLLNALQKTNVASPLNAALLFGGVALTENVFSKACNNVFGKTFSHPHLLFKKAISYGLAAYTTLKVMCLAGLIASVPSALAIGTSVGLYLLTKQVIVLTTPSAKLARPSIFDAPKLPDRPLKLDLRVY